jgi:hypothetical protein
MFQLTNQEVERLRSQIAISIGETREAGRGGRRYLPHAFTEHGAIMAATILNTPKATEVSVFVVRAFTRLREMVASSKELSKKLDELERRVTNHDAAITSIVRAIRELARHPSQSRGAASDSSRTTDPSRREYSHYPPPAIRRSRKSEGESQKCSTPLCGESRHSSLRVASLAVKVSALLGRAVGGGLSGPLYLIP